MQTINKYVKDYNQFDNIESFLDIGSYENKNMMNSQNLKNFPY